MPNSPRFLLDENVPSEVKKFLESKTLSAEYASKGILNGALAALSKKKHLVLLTRDSDFMNVSLFPPDKFAGIVVFQIHPPTSEKLVKALSLLLIECKEFEGKLFIVEEGGFEIIG